MEKRVSKRMPTRVALRFPCCNTVHSGVATNLSEDGMFINAELSFPIQSRLEILIPSGKEILKVPVKITRIVEKDKVYKGMGVELVNPQKNYLEFVIKLNLNCQS
ncbi:PilZ domain protein [bacterium BMS3Abin10]|nr:PilZ domain protein [bacterium BMS3Abin10]GBE40111.1 PilZ domain protein [bacterium BMS3Bbin08]